VGGMKACRVGLIGTNLAGGDAFTVALFFGDGGGPDSGV